MCNTKNPRHLSHMVNEHVYVAKAAMVKTVHVWIVPHDWPVQPETVVFVFLWVDSGKVPFSTSLGLPEPAAWKQIVVANVCALSRVSFGWVFACDQAFGASVF